jgi:hypothetical protein
MRAILRFFSMVFLAAAVIAGVADTIQSFAAEKAVLTPGSAIWDFAAPDAYDRLTVYAQGLPAGADIASLMERTFAQPAFALLLALSLIFWMLGYRKPNPAGRFAA